MGCRITKTRGAGRLPAKHTTMIFKTEQGTIFNTDMPAKSNLLLVFNEKGERVFDHLKLTGNFTYVEEFGERKAMVEVSHSFGTDEINEEFLWQ